jgi:hypothetical protein
MHVVVPHSGRIYRELDVVRTLVLYAEDTQGSGVSETSQEGFIILCEF